MMWKRSVTSLGSFSRRKASSRPASRPSNMCACPGYPAAVTIATCTLFCMRVMRCPIMALSWSKCDPSAYSVPSASKVMSFRWSADACTCAMFMMCLSSAKLGGMYRRRDRWNTESYSRNASTSLSCVKKWPTDGSRRLRRERLGSRRCSAIQRSIFIMTSSHVCVSCMRRIWSMSMSCSLRWPLRRSTLASDAERARPPNGSGPFCSQLPGLISSQ
mmetsp:Transcript_1789/g.4742  ORF Transcript_1789/g.4742 Transcript_1789/m.4742 type:complete len:217 (-) Transcript_1789:281-931(-)